MRSRYTGSASKKKTVLFIPGYFETLTSRNYASTIKAIEGRGYKVIFVPIDWKYKTITDWVTEFESTYTKYNPATTILAGFSYGSMIALISASKRPPAALWLFSLSPYFAEDLPNLNPTWLRGIGKRRVMDFQRLAFTPIATTITSPTLIFYGEKEASVWPPMKHRAEEARRLIKNSQLIQVPGAHHDVTDSRYIAEIKKAMHGLDKSSAS